MRGRERERRTHTLSRTQTHTHSRAEKTHTVGDYEAQAGPCTNTWLINLTSHTLHIHSWYKRDQKSRWASEDERGSRHQSRRKNGPVWVYLHVTPCGGRSVSSAVWCGRGYGRRGHSSLSPKKFSLHYLQESYGCPAMQSHAGDSLGHPPYPTTHSCTNAHTHTPTHVSHFPCHGFQLISRHTWKSDRPGSFWQKGKTFFVYFNYDWIKELGWNKIERKKMEKESSRQKERKECLIKRKAFRPPGRIWSLIHDGWSSDNTAC